MVRSPSLLPTSTQLSVENVPSVLENTTRSKFVLPPESTMRPLIGVFAMTVQSSAVATLAEISRSDQPPPSLFQIIRWPDLYVATEFGSAVRNIGAVTLLPGVLVAIDAAVDSNA